MSDDNAELVRLLTRSRMLLEAVRRGEDKDYEIRAHLKEIEGCPVVLKLCPFCYSSSLEPTNAINNQNSYFVHCKNCRATGPLKSTAKAAINFWNAR